MKVEYMEPFVKAACAVLEQVACRHAKPSTLGMLGAMYTTESINIATRVSGMLNGDVVFSMSSPTARKLAEKVMGDHDRYFGRLTGKALNQFGDMLVTKTQQSLGEQGFECNVSGPTVFRGLSVEFASTAPGLVVRLDTEAGKVDVNVAVQNGK